MGEVLVCLVVNSERVDMKTTLTLTLEIDVADLPAKELKECAKLASWDGNKVKPSELQGVDDFSADEIADHIVEHLRDGEQQEIWAGSEMYIRISDVRLLRANAKT